MRELADYPRQNPTASSGQTCFRKLPLAAMSRLTTCFPSAVSCGLRSMLLGLPVVRGALVLMRVAMVLAVGLAIFPVAVPAIRPVFMPVFAPVVKTGAAVSVIQHLFTIRIPKSAAHVAYFPVIGKAAALPTPAEKARAWIAKPVIHAAIVAHVNAPIAAVPEVHAVRQVPVSRREQQTGLRWRHPGSRHPNIGVGAIGPVTRGPDVALSGAGRLHVHAKRRRSHGN